MTTFSYKFWGRDRYGEAKQFTYTCSGPLFRRTGWSEYVDDMNLGRDRRPKVRDIIRHRWMTRRARCGPLA